jgi:hypothetical protein
MTWCIQRSKRNVEIVMKNKFSLIDKYCINKNNKKYYIIIILKSGKPPMALSIITCSLYKFHVITYISETKKRHV